MKLLISALFHKEPGTKFKVVDPVLLEKIPSIKGLELTLSVIKRSGPRTFVQYNSPSRGSGTLKIMADYEIEITQEGGAETFTLSHFITRFRYSDRRPTRIAIRDPKSNSPEWYTLLDGFWEQNHKNIYLKKIHTGRYEVKIPGSWMIEGIDVSVDDIFKKLGE